MVEHIQHLSFESLVKMDHFQKEPPPNLHFIRPLYVIQPFSLSTATVLVGVTSVTGFVIAFIFGVIWNKLHRYQGLE